MRARMTTTLATAAAILAGGAAAQTPPGARADLLQRVTACRSMADNQARLACFDAATAELDSAERQGELVVLDRSQIREAKRQAFGLQLSGAFSMFDRGDEAKADEVDKVTLTVARASRIADGRLLVTTSNGQVWRQIDGERDMDAPKPGTSVEVRRGSLGSYFMKLDGERSVRAHRDK